MESTDIQLARLDERMKMILDRMSDTQESNAKTQAWMNKVDNSLHDITSRVTNVESSLNRAAPTIEEFITIKHKVIGAGVAGKWMWLTMGTLLGLVISMREQLIRLFMTQGS